MFVLQELAGKMSSVLFVVRKEDYIYCCVLCIVIVYKKLLGDSQEELQKFSRIYCQYRYMKKTRCHCGAGNSIHQFVHQSLNNLSWFNSYSASHDN